MSSRADEDWKLPRCRRFHFAGVVPELGDDEVQLRFGIDVLFARTQPCPRMARPHRRHMGRCAGGDVQRGSVFVRRSDADVDLRLLIAQQYPSAGLKERALNRRNGADPFQRRRWIRRAAHDDDAIDQRFEAPEISRRDEGDDLRARGSDKQHEALSQVDGPAERLPRTLGHERLRRQLQVFLMAGEVAANTSVPQR